MAKSRANNKASSFTDGLYSYTISLTGVPGTGKTSIFNHVKRKARYDEESTVECGTLDGGIDCCVYSTLINGINFKVSLYDTGGLERYASLTSNYFHRSHAVILVYRYSNDTLDTITRLNAFIENALAYNRSPTYLLFAVWGHDNNETPSALKPEGIPELAKALMESNDIPLRNHQVVCANNDDDSRLMDALHDCILAVHNNMRPESQSVLTPVGIKLSDSLLDESNSYDNGHTETTCQDSRKKCCF